MYGGLLSVGSRMVSSQIKAFGSEVYELAEGPLWSAAEQKLLWVDVGGRSLLGRGLDSSRTESWSVVDRPACMAERRSGGLLLLSRNSLALGPGPGGPWQDIPDHGIDFSVLRINDGAVDRLGRFWFGTFSPKQEASDGWLCRLDTDLSVHRVAGGINMANGIAWSPDDRFLYFSDTRPGRIYRYRFSIADGTISDRTVFIDYQNRSGRPDGCTVDSEGYLWVAEVGGGRVSRYHPDATLDRVIELPVPRPTSVTFGGADLRTLFVTSMYLRVSAEDRLRWPLSGSVFYVDAGVAGVPETLFNS